MVVNAPEVALPRDRSGEVKNRIVNADSAIGVRTIRVAMPANPSIIYSLQMCPKVEGRLRLTGTPSRLAILRAVQDLEIEKWMFLIVETD